jgi:hypothetical protein
MVKNLSITHIQYNPTLLFKIKPNLPTSLPNYLCIYNYISSQYPKTLKIIKIHPKLHITHFSIVILKRYIYLLN